MECLHTLLSFSCIHINQQSAVAVLAEKFMAELQGVLRNKGVVINSVGNMFTPYFTEQSPRNFQDVNKSDLAAFAQFWRHMFANGIYLSPSQFESNFISIAHTDTHLEQVLNVANRF